MSWEITARHLSTFAVMAAALAVIAGCTEQTSTPPPTAGNGHQEAGSEVPAGQTDGNGERDATSQDVVRELGEAADAAADLAAEQKQQFEQSMSEQLERMDRQIAELNERAAALEDDAKAEWEQTRKQLEEKRGVLAARLDGLKQSSAEAWTTLKVELEDAFQELSDAVGNASAKFETQE